MEFFLLIRYHRASFHPSVVIIKTVLKTVLGTTDNILQLCVLPTKKGIMITIITVKLLQ